MQRKDKQRQNSLDESLTTGHFILHIRVRIHLSDSCFNLKSAKMNLCVATTGLKTFQEISRAGSASTTQNRTKSFAESCKTWVMCSATATSHCIYFHINIQDTPIAFLSDH